MASGGAGDVVTDVDCDACGEGWGEPNECHGSERACGHHCNHLQNGNCHWCSAHLSEDGESVVMPGVDCWVCHTPLATHNWWQRFCHRWVMWSYGDELTWGSSRG